MSGLWDELEKDPFETSLYEDAADMMEREHLKRDVPSESVLLKRHLSSGYHEHLWIQGYPNLRMIVHTWPRVVMGSGQTLPGCVRELPVGWRDMATAETFSAKLHGYVAQYEREGWRRA